ncbi:hypothetical protein CGK74_13830 [Thauera propionica]|uniref:Uncharacterized protein n=1 Tax=Thauera propionica TaxID=2019431 RepID=A0A235EW57_9RHOO|nr:hypothetical protein [Thauera propionica]OYD53288.1 hypothetical protein CGK74_13830 [Thauera propionica]
MSFKEASRITAHDGTVIVHSDAYEKVKAYLQEYACIEEIKADIAALNSQIQARTPDLKNAEVSMLEALWEHYDGAVPDYVEFSSAVIHIGDEGDVEVIRPRSYCDLYRIERPESTAA